MRRTILILATMVAVLLVVGGVAVAASIDCTDNPCVGTSAADYIYGTPSGETINALGGDDPFVDGRGGSDIINGGDGNDGELGGDYGNDKIYGDAGNDDLFGQWDNDYLSGGPGTDYCEGGYDTDTYSGCEQVSDIDQPELNR